MFRTSDNAGYIRINYTTNVDVANAVNLLAKHADKPVISHPGTMGGYRMPILEKIAEGWHFQVLKCPLPGSNEQHQQKLRAVLNDTHTLYEYVEGTTVTIVQVDGWNNKAQSLSDIGLNVRSSQKTFKRFKTVNRPFRFWWNPDRQLNVYVVDDTDYASDEGIEELGPEDLEKLLDGGFAISQEVYNECLNNVEFPELVGEALTSNSIRAVEFRRQAQNFRTFNARILGEFNYSGQGVTDEFAAQTGQLKGQAFVDVSDACSKMHVDVICTRSALKPEVSYNDTFVLLDPQLAKYHVTGDLQSITHNPALFVPEDVKAWMKTTLLGAFEDLKEDKLMEHWYRIGSPEFNAENAIKYDQDDLINFTKWNARAWLMSGMSLQHSPWLFEQMARNIVSVIRTTNIKKMRIPVPCAVRAQVISASMSAASGEDVEVPRGYLRWNKAHEVMVVNDLDWIEMGPSHGGHDLDDFFVGYWRTMGNQRVIFITRSPNDYGEYSMFFYHEGDWYPSHKLRDGSIVEFPHVSKNPDDYPKRLSEAVLDGDVIYTGLPSDKMQPFSTGDEWYGIADVDYALTNNKDSQACVGASVNARSLWSLCMRKHRKVQLAPMESCIDTGVQGGCMEDIKAVREEAQTIVKEIVDDPSIQIDNYLWQTRFMRLHDGTLPAKRLTSDTHVSQIHRQRIAFAKSFLNMTATHVNYYAGKNVNPLIHQLGKRHFKKGVQFLRFSRRAIAFSRQESDSLAPGFVWDDIHRYINTEIDKLDKLTDQHDMIMSIYSACLQVPAATTGRISDQLVMNPALFDRLMAALRHYGIAGHLIIDTDGHIRRVTDDHWELSCRQCGYSATITDPLTLQAHYAYDELCAKCTT